MRKLLVGVAVLCLLAPALSLVAGSLHASGTVVSVDLKAKSITLKYAYKNEPPKQATGKWDDRTKWWDQPQPFAEPRAMTAELAKSLKQGSTIAVEIEDGVLTEVTTIVPQPKD